MSTISKEQANYNLVNTQNVTAATDAINEQVVDQAIAAMIDAMNEVLSDSDLTELAEFANGSHFEFKTEEKRSPSDEQIDNLIDTMNEILDQSEEPTYELSTGKDLMLQLIAALQESQSKESEASNIVDQAHVASTLANAKQQAEDYKNDLQEMNKKHHWWNKVANIAKKSAPYAMVLVGVITENPALVVGGAMMLLMSKTPAVSGLTNEISKGLQQVIPALKEHPEIAHVIAAAITVVVITAVTGGLCCAGAGIEVAADEAAEVGTELADVSSENLSALKEEGSKSLSFNTEKAGKAAKSGARLGFAMSLSAESTTIAKSVASIIPEDDKWARRIVFATTELILMVVSLSAGYSGLKGMTVESEGVSAFSNISEKITETFGEDAGRIMEKVGSVVDFVSRNATTITSALMVLTGLANITLSASQMTYANAVAEMGKVQADLAILNSAEEINQAGLDQEEQDIKNVISTFLAEEKFADSMVDARNTLAALLAQ